MPVGAQVAAIAVVSLLGAVCEAAITLRWYEPPPRDDGDEPPRPAFEAVLFFLLSAVLFAVLGYVIAVVATSFGAVGEVATLLLTPVGFYAAYSTYTDRVRDGDPDASTRMGVVVAAVLGTYPAVLYGIARAAGA